MKIVHKINLVNAFGIVLVVFIAWFAYQNLNLVLTKVRFAEIADDLNASFLEMRISEKNYFLYKDPSALKTIKEKLDLSTKTIDSVKSDIIKAVGLKSFERLEMELEKYRKTIIRIRDNELTDEKTLKSVRDTGQSLREYSSTITQLERNQVNKIIAQSQKGLFYSFCVILVGLVGVSYTFVFSITRSLKQVENAAYHISEGGFHKVEKVKSNDEVGSVFKAMNFMSDELQKREEEILQSRKLASIGILTAGVAHELGNPLNNISMIAQAFIEVYDTLSKHDQIDFMTKIEEETDRIKEIVKNLLDFSRPKKPNLKKLNINIVVEKCLKLVQNLIHISKIDVHCCYSQNLPAITIDENQIQGVLINILTNSVQAMETGKNLNISTHLRQDDNIVEIAIEDSGKGIPADLLPHLFDPFFTTKGSSGVGLGLFVSYGIIKSHQGNIRVNSEEGVGTSFIIELPIIRKEEEKET